MQLEHGFLALLFDVLLFVVEFEVECVATTGEEEEVVALLLFIFFMSFLLSLVQRIMYQLLSF